jgi:type II secretory pathway component GspD/PulD (secretin)
VRPEVSSVSGYSDGIPIVDAATTDSALLVEDGNTVILGGLIKDEQRTVRKGVPVLASIPLLKYLFSSNSEETYKSELVILLTPRIMTGREEYVQEDWTR